MAPRTRQALAAPAQKLTIVAGYQARVGQIFYGDVRTLQHVRQAPDTVSVLKAGDGEVASRTKRVSISLAGGQLVAEAVRQAASALGLPSSTLEKKIADKTAQFARGYAASGPAAQELTRALAQLGLEWSIQGGQIQVHDASPTSTQAVVLSSTTGLIDSPIVAPPDDGLGLSKIEVRSLLNPLLVPGGLVKVESLYGASGLFRVEAVRHVGDTHGQDWYSTLEVSRAVVS